MNKDLTVGEPKKVLWKFCLPLFGSVIFQQLYVLADSWVAGKFIGEEGLAAVGNSYEITLVYYALAFGCNIGCSVITSRYFGARNYGKMKTAVSTAVLASGTICLLFMLLGILGGDRLLTVIQTPPSLFADSKLYLDIYTYGLPFMFFYNISTGIFSALGDSKTPFRFLAASSTANIAMDILFVKTFSMGVAGVAWATFICQGVSCILSVLVILQRLRSMKTEKFTFFSRDLLRQFFSIAVPSMLQQSFISVGNIVIQGVINGFGSGVVAGYAAAIKLNNLIVTSFVTIGNGISNYTSQNIGAGKEDRISGGYKAGLRFVWGLALPFALLYFFCPETLLRLFLDTPSTDALRSGILLLRIVAPFYFVVSAKLAADGVLRGAGRMKHFMIATFSDLLIRVTLCIFLSRTALGYMGIWCAWPVGWVTATLLSTLFYRKYINEFSS